MSISVIPAPDGALFASLDDVATLGEHSTSDEQLMHFAGKLGIPVTIVFGLRCVPVTEAGRLAAAVDQANAEHSALHEDWATGREVRQVERALRRLEQARQIAAAERGIDDLSQEKRQAFEEHIAAQKAEIRRKAEVERIERDGDDFATFAAKKGAAA